MVEYIVTSKIENKAYVRKLWNSDTREIEYDICYMKTSANTPISASEVMQGDVFIADQSNYLCATKFTPNRSHSIKSLLPEGSYKPYIPIFFPRFRSFSSIHQDFKFSFTFKLIDYCFIHSDGTILNSLKYYMSDLSNYVDFYNTKIAYRNYERAIAETFLYLDYIKYIADAIFNRYGYNLEGLYSSLQLRVNIINAVNWDCAVYNQAGIYEINFLTYSNVYYLIYSPKEAGLMSSSSSFLSLLEPNTQELKISLERDLENSKKTLEDTKIIVKKFLDFNVKKGQIGNLHSILNQMSIPQDHKAKFTVIIDSFLCIQCQQPGNLINLTCGHCICQLHFIELVNRATYNKVVFNCQEGVANFSCTKYTCGQQIHQNVIKENFPDYNRFAMMAEQRLRYFCSICRVQGGSDDFKLSCKHLCNSCTVDTIRSQNFSCSYCNYRLSENELNYFRSLKIQCVGCEDEFFWIKYFPKRLCNHYLCLKCIGLCTNMICFLNCPPFNITPSELKKLCKVQCEKCKSLYEKSEFYWMHKACECLICYNCQVSSGLEENLYRCSTCKTEFNEGVQIYLNKKYHEYINMPLRSCAICYYEIKISDIINLMECGHEFCYSCFDKNARILVDNISTINNLQYCPNNQICSASINPSQLESILDPELFQKFCYYQILNKYKLIKCPNCSADFVSGIVRKAICINNECQFTFCKSCSNVYHEEGDCNEIYLEERINEMKQMDEEGGVTQCPRCRIPYLKDPTGCKHVDCINPECRISFCFDCACIRSPLLAHGNHYHRKQCKDYNEYNGDDDKMKPDCSECQRLGKLCQRPKNLRVPRLVGPDEKE